MAFKGITFAGQNVTPANDGGLYNAHHGDGILWGCSMAISGDDLVIQSGEFIACGRVCWVDGATSVDLSGRVNANGYIQVIMNYDLTQGEGSQWYTTFVESATTTFPTLTTDDINDTGDLYQMQLAVVQVSGSNLTNITSSLGNSQLFTQQGTNAGAVYFLADDGTRQSRIISNASLLRVTQTTDNLNDTCGAEFAGEALIYADNNYVRLRPNGRTSASGQAWLNANGNFFTQSATGNTTGNLGLLDENGDAWGRIHASDTAVVYGKNVGGTDDASGMSVQDNAVYLFAPNGGTIYLRPNDSTTGQVYFNSSGQQIGGHPLIVDKSLTSAKSVSASTVTNLLSQTSGLVSDGIYMFSAYVGFTPSAGVGYCHVSLGTSATTQNILRNDSYMNSSGNHYFNLSGIFTGRTAVYFNIWSEKAGTTIANVGGLQIIRIH